ncbi:NEDD8 ultimate buster 1-like [Thrips palmi]|uniref:NEDD8 ultimate buster 1-like n=1 Tax=Thrips palmi TaxID=161013 RepID=A0A6P8ZYJ7_THRPL|nr:NEDD8 ultimate buster 1-like [Thrips palmi]
MGDDLRDELLRNAIRTQLRDRNVKLWMPPYAEESGKPNDKSLQALAEEFSTQLKLDKEDCLQMLLSLQENAIKRMKEQEQFRSGGIATLHIRFSGFSADVLPSTSKSSQDANAKNQTEVQISLNARGKDLADAVSQISGKPVDQIKLICGGRLLKQEQNLKDQGVKSSSKIMAIAINEDPNEVDKGLSYSKLCEKTRSAASTLSRKRNQYASLELENQTGSSLKLDQREKQALCLALALHERGRSALKRNENSLALLLFLEADQEFQQCNSDLLKSVDNVALLQLDIVWCYLCLRSMSHIPDADRRLNLCEATLERTYGKNLERVEALKGTAGNEAALLMRLHLLQAIVAFHLNKVSLSQELLRKAESELQSLKVNSDDIVQIVALGYSTSEALLGLRACQGDLNAAVIRISEWQEERKKAREESRKARHRERERRKLGKTADGSQYIEPDFVETLCGMGYDRYLAISALKHSNNHVTQAVHMLQEQPHLLDAKRRCVRVSSEDVVQISALGFDTDIARLALRKHNGNIEAAVADLFNNQGIITVTPDLAEAETDETATASTSAGEGVYDAETVAENDQRDQDEQMEAALELENDITNVENDHLCITLEEEENFLLEYKTLLKM